MEARNRKIEDWYGKIQRGEIKLPRFQRFEAWDWKRIASLLNTISHNLPLGITLVLEVGEKEQFVSRYLSSAPETNGRVLEHLLDGQQRLTALWRALQNNYQYETYFIYVPELDTQEGREGKQQHVFCRSRWFRNKLRYPLWCDSPKECLERGLIPVDLLKPEDIQNHIKDWVNQATDWKRPTAPEDFETFFNWKNSISAKIADLRSILKNYNLPYLSLPSSTSKDIALEVFINMNTNSKPLSTYDIIVAEVESVIGKSLHELQQDLSHKHPHIESYSDLSYLILNTSALLQEKIPNQRGAWEMDKAVMVENWDKMERGLSLMGDFLYNEGIIDQSRLPTNAVLSVIAALYAYIPDKGDVRGANELLLKKYLWSAFFTDRYENSAGTNAYYDYLALKKVITGELKDNQEPYNEVDVPIFNRQNHPLADADELMTAGWPKRETIRGKAVLAVACRLGSYDFATGHKVDRTNISKRHYHHIFPDALLKEAGVESFLALNCALIADNTNMSIGRKDPLVYLKDRYEWVLEEIVHDRLHSHLIPMKELANGGYEGLTDQGRIEKIKEDFASFLRRRATYFAKAAEFLTQGKNISATQVTRIAHEESEHLISPVAQQQDEAILS